MSRVDLSLTAGFILVVTVSVIQGQNGWTVTYTSNQICALEGSTVDIHCTYTYPSRIKDLDTEVEKTFWFIKLQNEEPVDLRADSQFSGRVQYHCSKNSCTLKITDLRVSDSAVYKFKFISNHPGGRYVGEPGVTLSVTDLKVVSKLSKYSYWAELKCRSSCSLPGHIFYIWYKNEEKIVMTETYSDYIDSQNSYSCAVRGHENLPSRPVCVHSESCNKVIYTGRSICAFKGSSVDISCTYNSYYYVTSKFWFSRQWQNPSQPEDLSKDSQYSGRVQVSETETGRSTLTITDLRDTDSAQYHFKFTTWYFEWRSSFRGTTLTVTDPTLQVQVIWSSVGPKLVCRSSCLPPGRSFVWYRNEKKIQGETSPSYSGYVDPADSYSCGIEGPEGYRSLPVYGPKFPLVLISNTGDIMKDSSVTLSCSFDAKPAPKYSWYKKNQTLPNEGPQLVFRSIQSLDSGDYYCTAENELGKTVSQHVLIDVKYGPMISKISVSPSAEIVEGSSVTLTCSSDANPAANYTWYKENEDSPKASGQIYNITDITPEHSGNYYCEAQNTRGRQNSTLCLIVASGALKSATTGTITAVLLIILLLLAAFLWLRRKKFFAQQCTHAERPDSRTQTNMVPLCDAPSSSAQRHPTQSQDDPDYASICFSQDHTDPVYSNVTSALSHRQTQDEDEDEQDGVEYTNVKFDRDSCAQGTRNHEDDSFALYSVVNKNDKKTT